MQPLSISLPTASAKTTIPIIAEGQYVKWQFKSLKEDKNDTGPFLTFTCKLAAPTTTTEGEPLTPDSPVGNMYWHKIYLYSKEKDPATGKPIQPERAVIDPATGGPLCPERSLTAISQFIDAILNTCDATNAKGLAKGKSPRPDFNDATLQAMVEQTFYAKMRVRNDEGYGLKNEFGQLLSEADMPSAT